MDTELTSPQRGRPNPVRRRGGGPQQPLGPHPAWTVIFALIAFVVLIEIAKCTA
jgi:hypothetical protein